MAKKKKKRGLIVSILLVMMLGGAYTGWIFYQKIYGPNFNLGNQKAVYLYIHTGDKFEQVVHSIDSMKICENIESFTWLAQRKNYPENIKPGRYLITSGMNNNVLINHLRLGLQEAVKLSFNTIRTKTQLVKRISEQLEAKEEDLYFALTNDSLLQKFSLDSNTIMAIFIPNTYQFYWNTSASGFVDRMYREYQNFWTEERKGKAALSGLSPEQVVVLASIVEQETSVNNEKPTIAGVYMNRLQQNMLLQADPTLIFAWNDYSIRRVLNSHKEIDSPYNTYKYSGLPPGPICLPSVSSIEAVLNYKKHSYLFFCAKEDFSGSHNFARTMAEHMENARKYQAALDKKHIKK